MYTVTKIELDEFFNTCYNNEIFDRVQSAKDIIDVDKEPYKFRRWVNEIITDKVLSSYEKLETIILKSIEEKRNLRFIPNFEELYNMVEIHTNKKFRLTSIEIPIITKLERFKNLMIKDRITKKGLKEFYPEFYEFYKQFIIIDPLDLYKVYGDVEHLFSMVESSDVKKCIDKLLIKPDTVRRKVRKGLTRPELQKIIDAYNFKGLDTTELYEIGKNYKFPITKKAFLLLKQMRKCKIYEGEVNYYDMEELKREIGTKNMERVPNILWKGVKNEFISICEMKPSELKRKRFEVLLGYYPRRREKLTQIYNKYHANR